ncbi:ABC transporter substrate-binding protein [Kineococcus sp. SYSU DK002]|uniref:ABC transporter substrate-binding protein n=1 Tax=Kineococcus sp. SYSU DK002 TaxID=3383123 RepID=UPI003D7DD402
MTLRQGPALGRRGVLAGFGGAAALVGAGIGGCSVQVRSQPDPTIGRDTMLINADKGNPLFDRRFNPYLTNKRTAATWIYEPLVLVNPLDGEQIPWLAESWELPDARTIDMTVRAAEWSDGTPFTARDVAFTFRLLREVPSLDTKGAWQHLESVEVSGDHVVLHLQTDDVPALPILGATCIVPEHLWSQVADPATFRDEDPVGTGPFVLGNYNDQQYSMDRNENYWQAEAVEIAHLVLPSTNSQLDTVTRGYDWSYSFISDVEGTWGAASPHNRFWFPPAGIVALVPNHTVAPFDDVDVRRGLSLALDRARIADVASEGYMGPAGQTGLMLPNQQDWLDPGIPDAGMVAQDTAAALAAFARAGYTQRDGRLVDAAGEQFSFALTSANGYTDWTRAAQEVQRQLAGIGVEVSLLLPQPAGYQSAIANGDFQVALGGMGNGDVFRAFNDLMSSEFVTDVGQTTAANFERFSDPEVDALLTRFKSTTDPAGQLQAARALQRQVYDKLPVIGLYHGGSWGLYNDAKFVGWPTEADPYMIPQNYDSAPLGIFTRLKLAGGAS